MMQLSKVMVQPEKSAAAVAGDLAELIREKTAHCQGANIQHVPGRTQVVVQLEQICNISKLGALSGSASITITDPTTLGLQTGPAQNSPRWRAVDCKFTRFHFNQWQLDGLFAMVTSDGQSFKKRYKGLFTWTEGDTPVVLNMESCSSDSDSCVTAQLRAKLNIDLGTDPFGHPWHPLSVLMGILFR